MIKRFDYEAVLDGVNKNIEITENQINDLQTDLNGLRQGEASGRRRTITQQLSVLKENLQLLKARRVYILGPDFSSKNGETRESEWKNPLENS